MRLLWIATKAPWPPRDGGRLLLAETLAALAARGARITLVAPVKASDRGAVTAALAGICEPRLVAARMRPRFLAALAAGLARRPYALVRHTRPELEREVARVLAAEPIDLVVAEQLQAFAHSAPAVRAGVPRILRAQNVESDLWRQLGEANRGFRRSVLLGEAARLARAERAAVESADATVALSTEDADHLRRLPGPLLRAAARTQEGVGARAEPIVEVIAPPFPGELAGAGQSLSGAPALVLFGSAGWEPNRRAERRFADEIWPRVRAVSPGAALHWFGGAAAGGAARPGIFFHPAPKESGDAFSPDSILVLPLDIASGVRMRVLEAWARGVALVATPAAASGLAASDGRELLLARGAEEFAVAIDRLATIPGLADRLIAGGRARLAADHAPERFAARFLALAGRLAERAAQRTGAGGSEAGRQ